MWSIGNHFLFSSFLFATFEKVSVGWSLPRFYFPFPERPNGHYTCAHTTGPTTGRTVHHHHQPTWWWTWWWLVGTHKYFIHHNRLVRSIIFAIAIRPLFFFFFFAFLKYLFSFLLQKDKRKKRDPPYFRMCARVLSLSRARVSALNIFLWTRRRAIAGVLYSLELCFSLALAPDVSCTNTHTGRKTETRYESVASFFFQKKEKKVPFKTEMIREQKKKKKKKRKMFQRRASRSEGKI